MRGRVEGPIHSREPQAVRMGRPVSTRLYICVSGLTIGVSEPILLVDRSQRIIGVLVGRPADVVGREPWEDTMAEAYRAMDALGEQMDWDDAQALP